MLTLKAAQAIRRAAREGQKTHGNWAKRLVSRQRIEHSTQGFSVPHPFDGALGAALAQSTSPVLSPGGFPATSNFAFRPRQKCPDRAVASTA